MLLASAAVAGAVGAVQDLFDMVTKQERACPYCLVGAALNFGMVPLVVPDALAAGMPAMPAFHPRMAGEQAGPSELRRLEPPGFLALHYGVRTPVASTLAHAVFGAILGAFYRMPG